MKAVQMKKTGSPEVLEYVDVDRPSPGKGQVLVKLESISINYADVMMRGGFYPAMPPLPAILGLEGSGIVESVGDGVTHVKSGQSVVVTGTVGCYAEYVVAESNLVIPIPDSLDKDLAAAFPVNYLTAYHMMHTMGHITSGQSILIHAAAGGVGTSIIQLAKIAGIRTIGLTSSSEKVQFAKEQGADHVINYKTENVSQKVNEITDGKGVELILNSVAGETFGQDFDMLAPLGQVIWYGFAAGMPSVNLTEVIGSHFMNSKGLRAFVIYNIFDIPELMSESSKLMVRYLQEERIKPVIHEKIPLAEASRAHQLLESQAVKGKLILTP